MNKYLKIILINLLFIVIFFISLEQIAYKNAENRMKIHSKDFIVTKTHLEPFWKNKMVDFEKEYDQSEKYSFRLPVGQKYKKEPVVIFGCSYANGYKLSDTQNFGYYLSKYSKRPVYNRSHNAWGLQHMFYQLSREDFYKEVPEPEYLIYVFLKTQIHMFYDYTFQLWDDDIYLRYKIKNGELVRAENPPKCIQSSYLLKSINKKLIRRAYDCEFNDNDAELALLYMLSAKKEASKHWKNTKFVFMFFDIDEMDYDLKVKLTEELSSNGIIVVNTSDINEESYENEKFHISKNDPHPNEKYWQTFMPKFVKTLNL